MSDSDFPVGPPAKPYAPIAGPPVMTNRPRLAYWSAGAVTSPAINRVAAALGVDLLVHDISRLDDQQTIATADAHWVVLDSDQDAHVYAATHARADGDLAALLVEATRETIDPVWAQFSERGDTVILVDPAEAECAAAMAQALSRRHAAFASAALDDQRSQQLARLQEEVHRISTLLSRLSLEGAGFGGGNGVPASPFIEPTPSIADDLRAPRRGYDGQPDFHALGVDRPTGAVSARIVRRVIRQRRMREELFIAELFADPAWDMMLDLFAARLERNRVSVSSLCIVAAVPATTALRWIKTMTDTGMFIRDADPHDKRRIHVALSEDCAARMGQYFLRLAEN